MDLTNTRMSTISANSIFHFTKNRETLINILQTKFYPKLCLEDMIFIKGNKKIAYPMVCFCDIPLSQITNHVNTYGKYAIGLKKSWAIQKGISPILYTHMSSLLCLNLKDSLSNIHKTINRESLSELNNIDKKLQLLYDLFYTSLYCKPYSGRQRINGEIKDITFYNEREWRYIPPKHSLIKNARENIAELFIYEKDFVEPLISKINQSNEKFGLEFTPSDINYIIVNTESEIPEILDTIQRISGDFSYNDVKLLSTRIISMDRISEDF